MNVKPASLMRIIGPGILVAATGVGAGDLATGAMAGSKLGIAVLWAVLVGAILKMIVTEGLARWQLVTGSTILEGALSRFGTFAKLVFLVYLVLWSLMVASALMSACGVTLHAILPWRGPSEDKIVYGVLHSAAAVLLIQAGGFRLFERIMSACIGIMFVTVVATAIALRPTWSAVAAGLFVPTIPDFAGDGFQWTVGLMGGVGGTLTILCYGYWMREEGRSDPSALTVCRIDLSVGYAATALFGMSMVIIGSQLGEIQGGGASLIVQLAIALETQLGSAGRFAKIAFLLGAWGAVFSSLLGVWQSVPYLFADFWRYHCDPSKRDSPIDKRSWAYQGYLFALALVPVVMLYQSFESIQKIYAIVGAMFIPLLAIVLIALNGNRQMVGESHRNSLATTIVLWLTILFFCVFGWLEIRRKVLNVTFHEYPAPTPNLMSGQSFLVAGSSATSGLRLESWLQHQGCVHLHSPGEMERACEQNARLGGELPLVLKLHNVQAGGCSELYVGRPLQERGNSVRHLLIANSGCGHRPLDDADS